MTSSWGADRWTLDRHGRRARRRVAGLVRSVALRRLARAAPATPCFGCRQSLEGTDADLGLAAGDLEVDGEFGELDLRAGRRVAPTSSGSADAVTADVSAGRADLDLADVVARRSCHGQRGFAQRRLSAAAARRDRDVDVSAGSMDLTVPEGDYDVTSDVSAGDFDNRVGSAGSIEHDRVQVSAGRRPPRGVSLPPSVYERFSPLRRPDERRNSFVNGRGGGAQGPTDAAPAANPSARPRPPRGGTCRARAGARSTRAPGQIEARRRGRRDRGRRRPGASPPCPSRGRPAAAISSATQGIVTTSGRPSASVRPRRSSKTCTPPAPIAESVWPSRHARPEGVRDDDPDLDAEQRAQPRREGARAEASGSTGSSSTVPSGVFDASTPAAADTMPSRFCDDASRAAVRRRAGGDDPDGLGRDRVLAVVGRDHAAFGLRHDLRRHHEDVAVREGAGRGIRDHATPDPPPA